MNPTEISVKIILDRWHASIVGCTKSLQALSDDQLLSEIAPTKNRGIYLLGHLIAVHDEMLVLMDLGNKMYPDLYEPFIKNADKVTKDLPSVATLRNYWAIQCDQMKEKFDTYSTAQWFEKHTSVSAEDFAKEPHRNKLNIVLTRTTHLQYHLGQLNLLK